MPALTIDFTSLEFDDAEPVKREGSGRKADPNPFIGIVKEIALQTDDNGVPVAKSFTLPVSSTDPEGKKIVDKALRQLSSAGLVCNPQVQVRKSFAPGKYKNGNENPNTTQITFWTVKKSKATDEQTDDNGE
jgi:hypothetical protein